MCKEAAGEGRDWKGLRPPNLLIWLVGPLVLVPKLKLSQYLSFVLLFFIPDLPSPSFPEIRSMHFMISLDCEIADLRRVH